MKVLSLDYYKHPDVLFLSQDLLGKFLFTQIGSDLTGGMIIETEAYRAPDDRASHAYANRKTKRNAVMFNEGGVAYVYLCYGIHALFNVVTGSEGTPHAILIRALEPVTGVNKMLERRKKTKLVRGLTHGPGALSQALGITTKHNGQSLAGPTIWIEDQGVVISPKEIITSSRIGVDYAGEDALLPWRFCIKNLWSH
jgi:DNA-3-methyladenine glycosylase